ncbi:HIG1 domain family member 1C [Galendromus occidentalis]|uniref:HIG1 domain family member 1C n=1 Tax=Galendromus occidentalis TaxID=34638 RepID=A0AAJ6QVH4_9ACAR|nr:HIG1 domain family member 1C [Galendromus occidentalis]
MASDPNTLSGLSESLQDAEVQEGRLKKKIRENPFMIAGLTCLVGIASYGLYNMKNRKMRPSIYLLQLRVAAQGSLVFCLVGGAAVELFGTLKKKYYESADNGEK